MRETAVKPKELRSVKVKGGICERCRDGAVHSEMDSVGERDMGIGETERRSIRNVYRCCTQKDKHIYSLQKEEF